MSGGTIFKKQIADNGFGTGDNCLIIDKNYAYQVPFSFGDNWNKIKIGMFLSFVSGSELNVGDAQSNGFQDAGGSTNDTFNWIGIVRNANTKSLPLDTVNKGFVGHKSNAINHNSSSVNPQFNQLCIFDADQSRFDSTTEGNALGISTFGTSTLSTGFIEDDKGNIPAIIATQGSQINLAEPEHSGSVGETGRGFCTYVGMTFEVNNKGQADQKISMTMHSHDQLLTSSGPATSKQANVSMDNLKFFINGADIDETQDTHTDLGNAAENQITGLVFNDGTSAYSLPDSFFFYNALPQSKPRIHAWAVKRFS